MKLPTRRNLLFGLLFACLLWNAATIKASSAQLALAWTGAPGQEEQGKEAADARNELYFKIINFTLLVVGLGYLLRKPLGEFLAQRSEGIRKALDEGRAAVEASQAKLSAVEEKLSRLEQEIAAFKVSAEKEMQQERQRLVEETAREAEKIQETARVRMDSAVRKARLDLKAYTAQEALRLAEQMIRERVDDAVRSRLVSEFIRTLEAREKRN